MKIHRFIDRFFIFAGVLLMSGCVITIGPLEDNDTGAGDKTSVLPPPKGGQEPGPLDEAQQARKNEADRYIAEVVYQGATILEAIQLPSGDIIDGLDRNTLAALPYTPPLPFPPDYLTLPAGVELGVADFEQYPELAQLVAAAALSSARTSRSTSWARQMRPPSRTISTATT